ncbi:hypothetical protein MRX96_011238 [Rhipicephalus microplus]
MSKSATWRILAVLLLLLLALALPDPCSTRSVNPRRRREVVKRAKPPGGTRRRRRPANHGAPGGYRPKRRHWSPSERHRG